MKKKSLSLIVVIILACFCSYAAENKTPEKPGLLIIAHGAPMSFWNAPVLSLGKKVAELNKKENAFHAVYTSLLEFTQPDIATGVEFLEKAGCDHIIAVPLFIAPSSHTHFDLPAALGIYTSPEIRKILKSEGARIACPKIPVTVTQTLDAGNILDQFALSEFKRLSKDPENEALVLLSHGCPDHEKLVEQMMRRVMTFCLGKTAISRGDWGYCEMGQNYGTEVLPILARAAAAKKRVIVVTLYVSSSAKSVHKRAMKGMKGPMGMKFENPLKGHDIVFSDRGFVTFPSAASWVLDMGKSAISD
jgi:protoheme ferro-lyase